jgi:MFS family permease
MKSSGDAKREGHPLADEAHNVYINAWHGAAQNAAQNLVTPFLGINLIRLGGTDLEIGLLNALPPLATALSTLIGARFVGGRRHARAITTWLFVAARSAFIALAVANFLPHRWAPAVLVTVIGLMNIPQAISLVSWQAIITGLLSPTTRGSALALRSTLSSAAGIVMVLLAGWWTANAPGVSRYPDLDLLACVLAAVEIFLFTRLRGDPPVQTLPPHLLSASRRLWRRPRFRRHILATLPFYLGWMMAWPLILRYQVDVAHANNFWIAAFTATNGLCAALTAPLWGRVAARLGPGLTLSLSVLGLSFVPFVYLFHPPLPGILIAEILGGGMGAGVNMMLLLRMMEVTPGGDRILGMAVGSTLMGVAGLAGPLLGTALADILTIPAVFVIPFALRLAGGVTLYWVQRPRCPLIARTAD